MEFHVPDIEGGDGASKKTAPVERSPLNGTVGSGTKKRTWIGSFVALATAAICVGITVPLAAKHQRSVSDLTGDVAAAHGTATRRRLEIVSVPNEGAERQDATFENAEVPRRMRIQAVSDGDDADKDTSYRFDEQIQPFGPQVLASYDSCSDLQTDIETALKQLADLVIEHNKNRTDCYRWEDDDEYYEEDVTVKSQDAAPAPVSSREQEDSYETNVQVDGVDEADAVKSDGEYIFAAYGTEIVMMNLEGDVVDRIPVPPAENPNANNGDNDATYSSDEYDEDDAPERTIEGLLLDKENKLITAITHHYLWGWDWMTPPVVTGGITTAFIYDFQNGTLALVGSVDISGKYSTARSIGMNAYIITNADIETYPFISPMDRCENESYDNMTNEEYEIAAFNYANATVSNYAQQIVAELRFENHENGCENIVQISSMTQGANNTEEVSTERKLDLSDGYGFLNSFVQITSFGIPEASLQTAEKNILRGVNVAGTFQPDTTDNTYASSDFIVVASTGYRQDEVDLSWEQYTFLTSFAVEDGKTVPNAVGEVRGYMLNQFSMDYYDDEFRTATTNWDKWALVETGSSGIRRWKKVEDSSSQVTRMRFVNAGMQQIGQLQDLGIGEEMKSCRFLGDHAYVVTYEYTDPLYVINMNPDNGPDPDILGELNVTGYSTYLHPVGENNEYLLAVGRAVDSEGDEYGTKISLFDVSDDSNPTELHTYVADGSSSAAEWDHHAFRYLSGSEKLILPKKIEEYRSPDNWEGFELYNVDVVTGIEPSGNVTHANATILNGAMDWNCPVVCFGDATLSPRSMVFAGDLVTFKGHTVKMSKNLSTLDDAWLKDLDEGRSRENGDDCHWWGGYIFW